MVVQCSAAPAFPPPPPPPDVLGPVGGTSSVDHDSVAENITHIVVDGERGILRTPHLSVLVALAKAICTWIIAKLCSLREELGGVLVVDKDDIVDAPLMEERKELRSGMDCLCGLVTATPAILAEVPVL